MDDFFVKKKDEPEIIPLHVMFEGNKRSSAQILARIYLFRFTLASLLRNGPNFLRARRSAAAIVAKRQMANFCADTRHGHANNHGHGPSIFQVSQESSVPQRISSLLERSGGVEEFRFRGDEIQDADMRKAEENYLT